MKAYPRIVLAAPEIRMAVSVGSERSIRSMLGKIEGKYGCPGRSWEKDIEGAAAELAFHKLMNWHWAGDRPGPFKAPDADCNVQIRSTPVADGRLIIHTDEADDHWFVLMRGRTPVWEFCGGIMGRAAKKRQWLTTSRPDRPQPAYYVPADALRLPSRFLEGGQDAA